MVAADARAAHEKAIYGARVQIPRRRLLVSEPLQLYIQPIRTLLDSRPPIIVSTPNVDLSFITRSRFHRSPIMSGTPEFQDSVGQFEYNEPIGAYIQGHSVSTTIEAAIPKEDVRM